MKNFITTLILIHLSFSTFGQLVGKYEKGPFLLKGATIHPVVGEVFVGDLLIEGEKISQVAANVSTFAAVNTINCKGKHIYPGFIDAGTHLGLGEISAVSLTNDFNEIGEFIPQMQALTAVNPNSVAIPVTRINGVTTVLTYPSGGRVSGTAATIDLVGYTPEQMYAGFKGVIMEWPTTGRGGSWDRRSDEEIKKENEKVLKSIDEYWDNATLFCKIDSTAKAQNKKTENYKPEFTALFPVLQGKMSLLIEVNKDKDIEKAIDWAKARNLKVILTGVKEGYRVAKKIKDSGYPVITGPILSTPSRNADKYDAAYTNAAQMMKAGIKVALRTNDTENVRNLPFNAGFAAAYGMDIDEALKAITINTAEIFGMDKLYGSISAGKVANIIVTDGDPFETKTQVEQLFIRGLKIPLESRHTLLYEEFLDRQPGLNKE